MSVIFIVGCENQPPSHIQGGTPSENSKKYVINYFKDTRTGLCFAETGQGEMHTLACVPCTEEVEAMIKK